MLWYHKLKIHEIDESVEVLLLAGYKLSEKFREKKAEASIFFSEFFTLLIKKWMHHTHLFRNGGFLLYIGRLLGAIQLFQSSYFDVQCL